MRSRAPYCLIAATLLNAGAQWAFIIDANNNGRLVDSNNDAPGAANDAIMIKRFRGSGGVDPRDIYVSKSTTTGMASTDENGGLFRYATQGTVETNRTARISVSCRPSSAQTDWVDWRYWTTPSARSRCSRIGPPR